MQEEKEELEKRNNDVNYCIEEWEKFTTLTEEEWNNFTEMLLTEGIVYEK